eukprot:g2893.t2
MKVEEIRILSKKRKQSQRVGGGGGGGGSNGVVISKGAASNGKAAKRPLSNGNGCGAGSPSSAKGGSGGGSSAQQVGGAAPSPSLSKTSSTGGSEGSKDAKDAAAARRRFVWSVPLHQDFVAAVFDVGLKCASPKLLLEMMPVVDGLTSEHIKSHLQKYRLHRQRSREEFLKSYNYLTDLDGGKGLGGGSAAATVAKAAAAAAGGGGGGGGDSKLQFSGSGGGMDPEAAGCGSGCGCEGASKGGAGGGQAASGDVGGDQRRKMSAKSTSGDESVESGGGGGGGGAKAKALPAGGLHPAVCEAQRLQQLQAAAPGEAVSGSLLLAHLELLAKGIDMQVKFHSHLRDVVESQQQLHAQLVEQQRNGHLRQIHTDGAGRSVPRIIPPTTAGETTPPASDSSPPALQQQQQQHAAGGGGVIAKGQDQAQKEVNLVGGGGGRPGALAVYRTLSGPGKAAFPAAGNLGWSGAAAGSRTPGDSLAAAAAAERGDKGNTAQTPRRRLSQAGAMQSEAAAAAVAAADASVISARSVSGPRQDNAVHHPSLQGGRTGGLGDAQQPLPPTPPQQLQQQHQHQHNQQFNPAAMREAFSVQQVAGGLSLPQSLRPASRQASGVGSRGYVPGQYTLTSSKTSGTDACGGAPHGHAQAALFGLGDGRFGAHGADFAARSPAEARAALAAAGLAPPTAPPTTAVASGQDTLTIQRHMQAQISMHQSMLSACTDQATIFGQRPWCGGSGMAPAFDGGGGGGGGGAGESTSSGAPRSSSRGTDGVEAGQQKGSGDGGGGSSVSGGGGSSVSGGGGGMGEGASALLGNKEQRLDALALHPPDAGDSSAAIVGMGLLQHQDDVFDFGMLEREGELKSGDNPAGAAGAPGRPSGDEHSTLFSFLME